MITLKKLIMEFKELVLFHGSNKKFDKIEADKNLAGIYMTTDIEAAKEYGIYIYRYSVSEKAKILDLSDGYDLLDYIAKNKLIDNIDVDLENYIVSGNLFQYDLSSKTRYMDEVVLMAKHQGYDIVKVPDDLHGKGNNIAYIVMNPDVLRKM